jgi:AcrR family transcriptional regulator
MAAGDVDNAPPDDDSDRYRPLPTGSHGLDPELVKADQRERLRKAMIELIAAKGYPSVRILDLAKLAHVSQPTFYSLFGDKEDLFLSAYDEIAQQTARTVLAAYAIEGSQDERMRAAMRGFAELAVAEPTAMSLLMLGAFGAGAKALERRRSMLETL